jgi:succinate dehydrogenase / fumarate reductase cytochrome b subunit
MCFQWNSSITKKQIVAVTGLVLVLFIIGHLAGNLFIYGGPEAFNGYAKKLKGLGALLWVARGAILVIFLTHVSVTYLLVLENIKARGSKRYQVDVPSISWAQRLMPYSGAYLFFYIIWHLLDFTFSDKHGLRSVINGHSYGLYGVVVNAFADPLHGLLYIMAMCFLGLHLAHGVESFIQTLGFDHARWAKGLKCFSECFALAVVVGYSSIPVYIYFILTGHSYVGL